MALVFELVVNYGQNPSAAAEGSRIVQHHQPLRAGNHEVPLHPPLLTEITSVDGGRYLEMSVMPVAVGYNVAIDRDRPRLSLNLGELTELGHGLYRLLARLNGYRAARVGWDPEPFVDLGELRQEWLEELTHGDLPGLVLSDEVRRSFPPCAGFEAFSPGFSWIPYDGERRT